MKKSLLLAVALLLTVVGRAYDFSAVAPSGQTLYYNIVSGAAEVTHPGAGSSNSWSGYTQPTGVLTIPSSVTYNDTAYSVTSIGALAFRNCSSLTSVTIPTSVTSIVRGAFAGCSGLTSVAIPTSVTSIEDYAFYECSALISVVIPDAVASIGEYAFRNCSSLTSVTIGKSVTSIGKYAFLQCGSLATVNFLAKNCSYAYGRDYNPFPPYFYAYDLPFHNDTSITTVTIGDSVQSIPECFLYGCGGIKSITVGSAVVSIGDYAFYGSESIDTIVCRRGNPPVVFAHTFPFTAVNPVVQVPCGRGNQYHASGFWAYFNNIQEQCARASIAAGSSNPEYGTVMGSGEYDIESNATLIAIPAAHHVFTGWNDGITLNPRTITVLSDSTFTAHFAAFVADTIHDTLIQQLDFHDLTVLSTNNSQGIGVGTGRFPVGTVVEICALPLEGYRFTQWHDGSTDNPRTIALTSDLTLFANFEQAPSTQDIGHVPEASSIRLWPNPASDHVVVEGYEGEVQVIDAQGRVVMRGWANECSPLQLSLASGAYFVRCGQEVRKLIVQ